MSLSRLLFASAIVDHVDRGVLDAEQLASYAIHQLNAAQRLLGSQVVMKAVENSDPDPDLGPTPVARSLPAMSGSVRSTSGGYERFNVDQTPGGREDAT